MNVFFFVSPESDLGPLELLRLCHRDRAVVRVWIRHCVGVRGMCEGVPIAFDRHMNIVLCDVTEQYVPFKTFSNGGVVESRRKRKKRNKKEALKVEERQAVERPPSGVASSTAAVTCSHMTVTQDVVTRHLKQLFIRGDNIIMICRLPPPPTITDS